MPKNEVQIFDGYGGHKRHRKHKKHSRRHKSHHLSGHRSRFKHAAKACGGHGYSQHQFRQCMKKKLKGH